MGLTSSQEIKINREQLDHLGDLAAADDFGGFKKATKEYFKELNLIGFTHLILIGEIVENNHNPMKYINFYMLQLLKWSKKKEIPISQHIINQSCIYPACLEWLLKNNMTPDQNKINKIYQKSKYEESRKILEDNGIR